MKNKSVGNTQHSSAGRTTSGRRARALVVASVAVALGSFVTPASVAIADAGDYSLDFVASAPYTYDHADGGGAFDDRTIGVDKDVVESLEGGDFRCGDHVSFLTQINRKEEPSDTSSETLELKFSFLADTTGQSGIAMTALLFADLNNGVIAEGAGDGPGGFDLGNPDGADSAVIDVVRTPVKSPFTKGARTEVVLKVTDLEEGDQVVLRIDMLLDCQAPFTPTGNLQAELVYAKVVPSVGRAGNVSVGRQTIPFRNVDAVYPLQTSTFANVESLSPVTRADKVASLASGSVARSASSLPETGSSNTIQLVQLGALLATAGAVGLIAARRRTLAAQSRQR